MKNADPALALLVYRSTPNESGYSPAELLMGRKLRTRLPELSKCLLPSQLDHAQFRQWDTAFRAKQKANYDHRHRTVPEITLAPGTITYIPDKQVKGIIVEQCAPRSYMVPADNGRAYRRNCTMLRSGPVSYTHLTLPTIYSV